MECRGFGACCPIHCFSVLFTRDLEGNRHFVESGSAIMVRCFIEALALTLFLVGCGTQVAISGKEREEYLHRIKPYGARWVKEGMTRESRRADWVACGGAADLQNGFRKWVSPEPWEKYWSEHERHVGQLRICMQSKNYKYRSPQRPGKSDECDASCLYP
jgi:hypothetical protein